MPDPRSDTSTVLDEPGWGGGGTVIDTSGDFMHLPKKDRAKAKERAKARDDKWRNAMEVRKNWDESDFEREREELEQQITDFLDKQRRAV